MNNQEKDKVVKTDQEWKRELSGDEYYILRKKGTERAFTGKYYDFYEKGKYHCAGCGSFLFYSETKYSSGCGWPSFFEAQAENSIVYSEDKSLGMNRIEITCARCDGHLGHVFPDGPEPTGKRYCVNSAALEFVPDTTESVKKPKE